METKQLKYYKVFLASSNELSEDRKHFFLYKDKINKIIEKFGYQIQVERWEITDPAFPSGRGQDEYNKLLKDCDECIVLFWKKRGNFSKEELDVAYEGFKNGGKPNRLTVYFKEVDEKEMEPELIEFKKDFLKQYGGRFYVSYRNIESVECDFLLFFINNIAVDIKDRLNIQNSDIFLDGEEMGNISNLSLAYNNKPYQKLSKEVSDLNNALRLLESTNSDNASIPLLKNQLSEKKKELQKFENNLMEMAQTITRITTSDPDNEKVALAQKQFAEGNYYEALAILNREEILAEAAQCNADFDSARTLADKAKDKYRVAIETIILRIQYLSVAKVKNWFNECKELYEKAVLHARNCYADFELADLLFKQAVFLQSNNQFANSLSVYEEVLVFYRQLAEATPEAYLPNVAGTLNNLGNLHQITGKHGDAEKEYGEALEKYRQLAKVSPDVCLPYVATILNHLGALHENTSEYSNADKEYQEALKIWRKLVKANPKTYLPGMAMTLNNLGEFHRIIDKHTKAEKELEEALYTFRKLAETCPETYISYVAMTLNNLGNLHSNTGKHGDAEKEYDEALKIRHQLAEVSPEAYLPDVAMILNNLGLLHSNTDKHADAEKEYKEAFEKYCYLAEISPEAYLPYVAETLNNLGNLHIDTGKLIDAEKEYKESLEIRRKLAETSPKAYLSMVASTLRNFAILRVMQGNFSDAEQMAQESLEKYQIMAKLNPAKFNKDIDDAKVVLAIIHEIQVKKE